MEKFGRNSNTFLNFRLHKENLHFFRKGHSNLNGVINVGQKLLKNLLKMYFQLKVANVISFMLKAYSCGATLFSFAENTLKHFGGACTLRLKRIFSE